MSYRSRRSDLALLWHQVRYEQLSFWRNPQSAFFTFVFPVVIIMIFGALFGGVNPSSYFDGLSAMQYYVPTIAAVSVLGSCYSQLAIVLSIRRQNGILKRVRATPLPAWAYFLGLLAHCVMVSVLDVALIVGVGRLYGVPVPSHWLALAAALAGGAASFCALGVAVASLIRNAEAAPAVVQLVRRSTRPCSAPWPGTPAWTGGTSACCSPGARPGLSWPSAASAGIPGRNDRRAAPARPSPRPAPS